MFSPGQFFYKSNGPIVASDPSINSELTPVLPQFRDDYMLGVYGGLKTEGSDVLGEEQPMEYVLRAQDAPLGTKLVIWPWTRSTLDRQSKAGSPYNVLGIGTNEPLGRNNFNGIRDGIIFVLTAGEDVPSAAGTNTQQPQS